MAHRTQNAIRQSFIDLLGEQPFDKISVRDITERIDISRNTFYYYYQDIYALTEDIFESEIELVLQKHKEYASWQRAFLDATSFALAHRTAIFHIYHSNHRNLLERYYHKTILTAILSFVQQEAEGLHVPSHKILALARFYAAALTGLTAEWLNNGMKGEPERFLADLETMLDGNIRHALERVSTIQTQFETAEYQKTCRMDSVL